MGYSFLDFMKRIGIFIVCAQSIIHFTAGRSYEKYIKLLIGIMLLGQFIIPVRALFMGNDKAEIWQAVERFQEEMDIAFEGTKIDYEDSQAGDALEEEIKDRIGGIASKYGFIIEDTVISEEPPGIIVTVSKGKEDIHVDKIAVDIGGLPQEEEEFDSLKEEMRKEFAVCLGTEEDYMKIKSR